MRVVEWIVPSGLVTKVKTGGPAQELGESGPPNLGLKPPD